MLAAANPLSAQVNDPVKWTYNLQYLGANMYELRVTAEILPGWKLYAPGEDKGGPLPTTIRFPELNGAVLKDSLRETGQRHTAFDQNFEMEVSYYNDKAVFIQHVKRGRKKKVDITCTVEYMACDSMQCLPPEVISWKIPLQ